MKKFLSAFIAFVCILSSCNKEQDIPESNQEQEQQQTLELSTDKDEIPADGVSKVTFTVKDGNDAVVSGAVICFEETGETLDGNTFATETVGEYSFYAVSGEVRSNVVSIKAVEVKETPEPKTLLLEVDNTVITADGEQTATFSATVDGEAVEATLYNAADDTAMEGMTFSTTEAGTYTFYAMYEELKSKEVSVVAEAVVVEEKPIVIECSLSTIKANGVESTEFTVTQEGEDVTDDSAIYVNGGLLSGHRFSTVTPGTYTVYAVKGTVTSNEITITAEAVQTTGKVIVFAEGVTISSGWYDVNKVGRGDINGDINMCWAAASSNMIQWFQDRYVAAGNTLPENAISGPDPDGIYELALMKMYHDEWDNSRGGNVEEAIPWYFEGKTYGADYATPGSQATPLTEGGYWKDIWETEVYPYVYHEYSIVVVKNVIEFHNTYTANYNNYYLWGNGSDLEGVDRLKYFSDLVVETFKHGMASVTINLSPTFVSSSHAVTLWGYEIDQATGLLTRMWVTDSDDLETEPKHKVLHEYSVSIEEGRSPIKLTGDVRYGSCYIMDIIPFSGYGSAM